jgi:DNA-binding transcriptional LysR family regulator
MLLFTEVVATGAITSAAGRLGLRKSTVSRRLTALEERLGTRLLERNTRGLRLTEAGRTYHSQCVRIVAEAREANRALSDSRSTAQGTLRIATVALLGELLAPVIAELLLQHPQLSVEMSLAETHVDLIAGNHDLALRSGPLADSALVARKLGWMRVGCFASAAYLGRRGTPSSADSLRDHECVLLAEPGSEEVWFFGEGKRSRAVPVSGRLRVPSPRAGQAAARAGLGIVRLPAALVAADVRSGLLVPVLEAETPPGLVVSAVYPSSRQLPKKVRAFLDLLAAPRAALPWEAE